MADASIELVGPNEVSEIVGLYNQIFRPPRDAEVVARLRAAGAIILAKANMGEYAAGDRSTSGGTTCNPYDTTRSAGRSSGGSGAAVAANLVPVRSAKRPVPRRATPHPTAASSGS